MPSAAPARSDRRRLHATGAALVAVAGALLALIGLTFAAAPLLVAGIGFVALGALAPAWVMLAARGAAVQRTLPATRIVEGERFDAILELRGSRFGLAGATVTDPLAGVGPLTLRRGRTPIQARFERRGRHAFAPPALHITDPLVLARAELHGPGLSDEVLVLPRTEPIRWLARSRRRSSPATVDSSSPSPHATGEIDGLRDYLPGTPATRIHWPALARGAGLLERRLAGDHAARPLIVLDARAERTSEGREALDAAVRAAASLALDLARRGGCGLLLPGSRSILQVGPDLAAWPALHARLALVERAAAAPAVRPTLSHSHLIWVTASPALAPERAGSQARELVLVAPLARVGGLDRPPAFEVAGCAGFVRSREASAGRLRVAR